MMGPMANGCCSMFWMIPGLFSMAAPLLAVGAIVYLLMKKPEPAEECEG